ncbi:MerR family transcriptional regulator [Nocardioides acrostichi]|nr:MerR family transcriptional regulator [Nocardioides acrostichi]
MGSHTIAEAADLVGLSTDTLRYYEKDGLLLRPVPRTSSGQRRYAVEDLQWLTMVTRLRSTGMPIRAIRRYAALVRAGSGNEVERLELLRAHRRTVLDQLAEITEHLGAIEAKIGIYEDTLDRGLDLERTRGSSVGV